MKRTEKMIEKDIELCINPLSSEFEYLINDKVLDG